MNFLHNFLIVVLSFVSLFHTNAYATTVDKSTNIKSEDSFIQQNLKNSTSTSGLRVATTPSSPRISTVPIGESALIKSLSASDSATVSVSDIQLINTDTQSVIADPFVDNSTVNLGVTPHINVNVLTNPSVIGSVVFGYDTNSKYRTENIVPYALNGDVNGKFNPWTPVVGTHTLTITPFSASNGTGSAGLASVIHFTVTNTVVAPTPTLIGNSSITKLQLINTDTQGVITDSFTNGGTINLGVTPHINLNAITNPAVVGSVIFKLDGKIHTENTAPYDIGGDTNGKFNPWNVTVGNHTLIVTPFSGSNGGGTAGTATTIVFSVTNTPVSPTPTPISATDDWTMNKYDSARSNYDPANTLITASSVANLKLIWNTPAASPSSAFGPNTVSTTPIVVNNVMYYGDWNGNYFARNTSDGSIVWQRNIGVDTPTSQCNPPSIGVADSAQIIGGVIYIGGGDGNMYALNASDGSIIWKTALGDITKGDFLWDSPVVYNGSIYEGVASFGDCPLVQGRIVKLDQATGTIQATAKLVPDGCIGAGEWASVTVDALNNKLYITTGTQDNSCKVNGVSFVEPNALAMVELDASTLAILGSSRIPLAEQGPDSDYGVSPALTTATVNGIVTQLVSGINKNGRLYIFKRDHISDGPIIDESLGSGGSCPDCGQGSISTAATTGNNIIYQGSGSTTINGTNYLASIRAIDVSTGAFVWEHGLVHALVASPTLLNGVLIVPNGNNIDFLNSSTGGLIRTITPAGAMSILDAPISVSRGKIFISDLNGSVFVYGL